MKGQKYPNLMSPVFQNPMIQKITLYVRNFHSVSSCRFQDRQTEWMAGLRYQDHNIPVHIRREFRRGKLAVKINTNSKEEAPGLLGQE